MYKMTTTLTKLIKHKLKHIFLFIFLLHTMSAIAVDKTTMAAYMQNHALVWEQLPMQWNEGAFLGNGRMGMIVYVDTLANAVTFHLGRPDVTDHRKAPQDKTSIGIPEADKMFDYCRLDVGKLQLVPEGKILSGTFRLDIYSAQLTASLQTTMGEIEFTAYTPYQEEVNVIELNTSTPYRWQSVPGNPQSPRIRIFPHLKEKKAYEFNPEPQLISGKSQGGWIQPLLAGGDYATYWKEVKAKKGGSTLYVSVANEVPKANVSYSKAESTVKLAIKRGATRLKQQMADWWSNYYHQSYLSIPDKQLENFYYIQMYKLATCSHPNGPVMDLLGTFFKLTSWPSIWWNLNVQLTYMPVYPSNRLEQGVNFQKLMDEVFLSMISGVSPAKIGDYTWSLQNYYSYLRYSGASWQEVIECFVPKAEGVLNKFRQAMHVQNDTIHLLDMESPEYEGFKHYKNSNYGLASLHWLLRTLITCHDQAGAYSPYYDEWNKMLSQLHPYPIDENGMMIASEKPLDKSHRHYSHLLAFYPFRLLDPNDDSTRELLQKSIDHWVTLENGKGLTGYSYTGAASLYAYLGDGDKAYAELNHFLNKPIGISLLLPNTLYVESQGKNPTIETPLSAATATTELLLQSYDQLIRVFPAIPQQWEECSFHQLRTEGAFLVSAQRRNGKTQWVEIKSEKGEPCHIFLPQWGEVYQVSKGRTTAITSQGDGVYHIDLKAGETIKLAPTQSTDSLPVLIDANEHSGRNHYGVKQGKGLPRIMEWPED